MGQPFVGKVPQAVEGVEESSNVLVYSSLRYNARRSLLSSILTVPVPRINAPRTSRLQRNEVQRTPSWFVAASSGGLGSGT